MSDSKPLIVQSDKTLLLEVNNDSFNVCRKKISAFAELEKSPEHFHTYRITPLSLWNAASSNISADYITECLYKYSKYPVQQSIIGYISNYISRYGLLQLKLDETGSLILSSKDKNYIQEIYRNQKTQEFIEGKKNDTCLYVKAKYRGHIKQALIRIGYPVEDIAGYSKGNEFKFGWKKDTNSEKNIFELRDYQKESVEIFYDNGSVNGGSGIIVLPCGAGKTIVGIAAMQLIGVQTLILVTNTISIRQWKNEILNTTDIKQADIGEYSGEKKEIKPITIATYNIITYKKAKGDHPKHFHLFSSANWGLIIYDEVHFLPAPVFRITSELQSKRRLGLTATLVREDNLENDVFSLIGPKKYGVPWKELEAKKWIAEAMCIEVRIPMRPLLRAIYSNLDDRGKFRVSSENPEKIRSVSALIKKHKKNQILIIGHYIEQLQKISKIFSIPIITGITPTSERSILYTQFRNKEINALVVSKVANFSIDLPDANIAIQISGTFGSRQEEAQRLGRILRPKKDNNKVIFYSLVTENSQEERFGHNRQLFLTEQGYQYKVLTYSKFKEEFKDYIIKHKIIKNKITSKSFNTK